MNLPTIRPVFNIDLGAKIVAGRVTVGKYDGCHPCLTVATTGDKILIHSPHRRNHTPTAGRVVWSESNKEMATLNMNQTITALKAGQFLPDDSKEVLIIGTSTHVLAYHPYNNMDIFYTSCPDGAHCLCLGPVGAPGGTPNLLVGGTSTVRCLDHTGKETWWTAIGDRVTSVLVLDFNADGYNEIIVSSEDYMIRVYKEDRLISEQTETEMVTGMVELPENRYAYSVSNGTIGVYEQDTRLWRVKSKNFAVSMLAYDLLCFGEKQLLTGWSSGKIDCRNSVTGEVAFKDQLNAGVAGVVEADYRATGINDLICVGVDGEVRGYATTKILPNMVPGSNPEQDTVRELLQQKQALLLELQQYEYNARYNEEGQSPRMDDNVGIIPANTRLQVGISTVEDNDPRVEVSVATNNDTIIRVVMIFAEGIFEGESLVIHPPENKLGNHILVPLKPPKDIPVDIHIKAFIGYRSTPQYHVFELTRQLPRFSMYCLIRHAPFPTTTGKAEFRVAERAQRVCMWLNQNFLLEEELEVEPDGALRLHMRALRDGAGLGIIVESGKVVVSGGMGVVSDVIRSLAGFLNLEQLQSTASFPEEEARLKALMESLKGIQDARLRLTTDVADRLGQIRGLIVKAEDSRLNAIHELSGHYQDLLVLNQELINGYNIRMANYNEGVETLKEINGIIQRASKLRVGKYSAEVINNCRTVIRNNNIEALIKIIRTGQI